MQLSVENIYLIIKSLGPNHDATINHRLISKVNITKTCPFNIQRCFRQVKLENFQWKNVDIFLPFAQTDIDCGYTLEPSRRGGSNEYPQSMFWSNNKKNRFTPANPSFSI